MAVALAQGMKTSNALDEFIASRDGGYKQPAHHRYILTVFGVYGRPAGKAIPVAVLVQLLAQLDVESSSVRSSISRLKKKGVLISKKTSAGSSYALVEGIEPHMQAGDERIFSWQCANLGEPWLMVSFSVPESERQNRHKIRAGLARMGFGTVAAGLYIGPARLEAEAVEFIREHQLWSYIQLFVGEPSCHGDIRTKIAQWWDLEALASEYQAFVDAYQQDVKIWQAHVQAGTATALDAFQCYVPMLTQWRRLPFLDPGLPSELLPTHWAGLTARQVFNDLHRLLKPLAAQYFDDVMNGRA